MLLQWQHQHFGKALPSPSDPSHLGLNLSLYHVCVECMWVLNVCGYVCTYVRGFDLCTLLFM